jgi:multiple sugar transport system substrate-binding protein
MFAQLIDAFHQRNPDIRIDLTVSGRDQNDQIQSTLRRSLIRDLPDVSFEGLNYLSILRRRNIAVLLNDLVGRDPEWDERLYSRSLLESGSVDNSIVGLGTAVSVPILYYNADVVSRAMGQATMPRQWDAILSLVQRIRQTSPGLVPGFCQHAGSDWMFMSLVESHGGHMMHADERSLAFDEAPGRRSLSIYREFGRNGQARSDMGRDQARQAFSGGGIGVLVDSSSSLTRIVDQVGGRFRVGTAGFPLAPGGRVPAAGIASVLMTRDPQRQRLAWRFMKFVAGPEGQMIIGRSTGYFPANHSVVSDPDRLGAYYAARPLVQPVIETLPSTSRWFAFPGNNSSKIHDIVVDGVSSVVTLSNTPEQAITVMKRRIVPLLPA